MNNTNAHKPGYKHTPLGWIPDEWEVKLFGEVFEYLSTNSYSREQLTGDMSSLMVQNIHYGDIHSKFKSEHLDFNLENVPYVKDDVFIGENASYLAEGDLVIADASEDYEGVGKSIEVKNIGSRRVLAGLHTIAVRDKSKHTAEGYRTYLLHNKLVSKELKRIATGISVYSISKGNISNIKLPLPTLSEQYKIATILSTWDEAIQKTQQLIEQLKQRNKGLMQQLLVARPEWKQFKLSDIFDRVTKKNTEGNKNVVTISAQRGFVRQDDFFNKLVASDTLDNYFLVERGDFCYNKSYSKGYDWGATKRLKDFDKAVVTTLYICFRLKKTANQSGEFFEYFFESGILDKGLSKVAHEGGRAHGLLNVTPDDFFSLKVYLPNKTEQDRIFSILHTADTELNLQRQQLTTLREQKKGLMQNLLSGEVRVKISND